MVELVEDVPVEAARNGSVIEKTEKDVVAQYGEEEDDDDAATRPWNVTQVHAREQLQRPRRRAPRRRAMSWWCNREQLCCCASR